MISAKITIQGKPTLVLGLAFANIDKLSETNNGVFLRLKGEDIDMPLDILLLVETDEDKMAETIKILSDSTDLLTGKLIHRN